MTPKQVLVIEGNVELREAFDLALLSAGYSVRHAASGPEAIDQLRRGLHCPTVILIDALLPSMDGRAFLAALYKLPEFRGTPVILCSGYRTLTDRDTEQGVSGYLGKPVDYRELIQMVASLDLCAMATDVRGPAQRARGQGADSARSQNLA